MKKENNPDFAPKLVDGKVVYVRRHKMDAFDYVNYIFLGLFSLL